MVTRRGVLQRGLPARIRRLQRLNGVLPTRVFESVDHLSGLNEPQLCTLLDVRPGRLASAVAQLNRGENEQAVAEALVQFHRAEEERAAARAQNRLTQAKDDLKIRDFLAPANHGELLVRIAVFDGPGGELTSDIHPFDGFPLPDPLFHMHYVSGEGTIVTEHRDESSLSHSRNRLYEDIRKDHNLEKPQLLHTLRQNDCMIALLKAKYKVSAGYRGCLYLTGGQQLVPDARMSAHLDLGEYPTEYLRRTRYSPTSQHARVVRDEIRQQLVSYVPDARILGGLTVACLCDNELLREMAREEAAKISRAHLVQLSVFPLLERLVTVAPPRPGMSEVIRRLWLPIEFYVEYEQSATSRADIKDKLMKYVRVARAGSPCDVIFICETEGAAALFREVHQNLQREFQVSFLLITSTYAEVSAGDRFESCWNLDGKTVRLS